VPGRQYSRGRTISIQSGTITTNTQDGIRYSREVEPPKRSFRIAWTDGVDISTLQGLEPEGFLQYVQGARKHFVYIPNISKSTSAAGDIRQINRDKEHALVTLDNDITIEHVVGDELQTQTGEVFRLANMSFTEVK
jgi:hypothetical protein